MTFKWKTIVLLVLFCGFWCSLHAQDSLQGYRIGPEDLIEISVFNVPELNKTLRVGQDGFIRLALVGKIQVSGMTRFDLEEKLAQLLEKKYLKNPQVTVFIKEYKSQSISIIGAVSDPGIYKLFGAKTLLNALTMAGGLTQEEDGRAIVIRQYRDNRTGSLKIDLDALMLGENPDLNIPLQAGDVINIPPRQRMSVYVFGQVKKPGEVKVHESGRATLLQAIASAGGFTERARKRGILIRRIVDGKEEKIIVNAIRILKGRDTNFLLREGDIVHVPESIL